MRARLEGLFPLVNWDPTPADLRGFGWAAVVLLPLIGTFGWWAFGWSPSAVAVLSGIGATILVLAFAVRPAARVVYLVLVTATAPIGFAVSQLILLVIWALMVTPLALVFRMMGRDHLRLRLDRSATTYWNDRDRPTPASRYFKLY